MAKNSHKHTRLVSYGRRGKPRKRGVGLWYLIPLALCLAFVFAIILGNVLGDKVSPIEGEASTEAPTKEPTLSPSPGGRAVIAHFVTLRGITYNTASAVATQIPENATAASMELFDSSGAPYYYSEVAESHGNSSGELTLKNIFKPTLEGGIYSSVLFPSSLLSVADSGKAATVSAYEASLAGELYLAGANEITVYFSPLGSFSESGDGLFEHVGAYVSAMRLWAGGLRVGITLTPSDLKSYAGSAGLEALCAHADFCAVDLSGLSDQDQLTDTLLSHASTVMRHEMRIIISERGKSEDFIAFQSELIEKLGINNIQYTE